ncbi:MAG: peptidoglycan-binding protein [Actinomycetota bacterium]|nr:peptidoglycan-binding protein [Actinomycetota bacterium]
MPHRIRRALGTIVAVALLGTGVVALDVPVAQAAYPVPPTPSGLTASIEAIQPYIGQSTCDPVAKPGVTAFRNLLLSTYTDSGSLGIVRDCGAGGQSEHKEGRAFDWKVSVYNTRQKAEADTLLNWLTKSDQYGNTYAMARRLGIMYMIWNRRIFKFYDAAAGWQAYSGASAHTDHVHFSFGWNGAKKTTSYWDGTVAPLDFGPAGPPHVTPVRKVGNIPVIRQYGTTTLGMHSTGTAVKVMQKALLVTDVDGDFGSGTQLHVMKFQVDQKLPMTGSFGSEEWKRLFPFPIAPFGALDVPSYVLGNAIVRGWTIDADTTEPIQVSAIVDGGVPTTVSALVPRSDVASSYPEWGANHGFQILIPLLDGTHEVCLVALNAIGTPGTDTQMGCSTINAQHNPVGALSSLTSALGTVSLTGWALDPDSPDVLSTSLTVDGVVSPVVPESVTRTDIGLRFPGIGDQHGVKAELSLPEGTHEVCLRAPNALNTPGSDATVGCRSVKVEHSPVSSLDFLRRSPAGVSVRGWALDPDVTAPVTVEVLSDGQVVRSLVASVTRADLGSTYASQGSDHGFSTAVSLPVGTHQVCVRVPNASGTPGTALALPCRSVVVSHDATGVVRALRTVPGGSVLLSGDAYDPDSLAASTVTALVDGKVVRTVTASASSSPAGLRWPGYGSGHGFVTTISPTAGRHTVCLRADNLTGTSGASKVLACRALWVHDGTGSLTSLVTSSRTITVRGWALDPDTRTASKAVLMVDGTAVTSVTASGLRRDLATLMPGYGSYHGFAFARTLSRGTHKVCVVARNLAGTPGSGRYVGCRTLTVA